MQNIYDYSPIIFIVEPERNTQLISIKVCVYVLALYIHIYIYTHIKMLTLLVETHYNVLYLRFYRRNITAHN